MESSQQAASDIYDQLSAQVVKSGADQALKELAEHLRQSGQYHDLFDVRLMQSRKRHGMSVSESPNLDELQEPLRTQMEDAYLDTCKEVGELLLSAGKIREAWMYLRPVGNRETVAAALARLAAQEELREQIIEIALHEGVAPRLGFELVLKHYGTCNSITMFDSQMHSRPKKDREECAALLINHLHEELARNLRADIARREGNTPTQTTIKGLVENRDWLFAEDQYHIDTSHLGSVVRFALEVTSRPVLALAADLTEYGRRLSSQFRYPGVEPFADTYVSHAHFFRAQLGEGVAEGIQYFQDKARTLSVEEHGTFPAETLAVLLSRLSRHKEAFDALAAGVPPGVRTTGFSPPLMQLAKAAGKFRELADISRERGDLVGYCMSLIESGAPAKPGANR